MPQPTSESFTTPLGDVVEIESSVRQQQTTSLYDLLPGSIHHYEKMIAKPSTDLSHFVELASIEYRDDAAAQHNKANWTK